MGKPMEVKLIKEMNKIIDDESIKTLQEEMDYEIMEDVTVNEIDIFSEKLYYELEA